MNISINKEETPEGTKFTMTSESELKTQANSPYNDGYTREFYQQELDNMDTKKRVNTDAYLEFVDGVTSEQSKDYEAFVYRIQELEGEEFEKALNKYGYEYTQIPSRY